MTDPGEGTTDPAGTDDTDETPPPQLGDPGKQALERMKARVKEANNRAKEAQELADQLRAQASAVDPETIEKQVRAKVAGEYLAASALDKLEVQAATMGVDPDVARAMLASRSGEFLDNGTVNPAAIKEALEKLVEEKPYLAARAGKRFNGSADGGARPATGAPEDMNTLIRRKAGY